jgi:hypothetical protein
MSNRKQVDQLFVIVTAIVTLHPLLWEIYSIVSIAIASAEIDLPFRDLILSAVFWVALITLSVLIARQMEVALKDLSKLWSFSVFCAIVVIIFVVSVYSLWTTPFQYLLDAYDPFTLFESLLRRMFMLVWLILAFVKAIGMLGAEKKQS